MTLYSAKTWVGIAPYSFMIVSYVPGGGGVGVGGGAKWAKFIARQ